MYTVYPVIFLGICWNTMKYPPLIIWDWKIQFGISKRLKNRLQHPFTPFIPLPDNVGLVVDLRCRTCVTGHFFTFCWCIWDLQAFWCRDQNWTVFSAKSKQRQGHEHDALRFFMPLKLKKQSQNGFVPNSAHSIQYLSLQLLLKMPVAKRNLATTFGAFWFVVRLLGFISETAPLCSEMLSHPVSWERYHVGDPVTEEWPSASSRWCHNVPHSWILSTKTISEYSRANSDLWHLWLWTPELMKEMSICLENRPLHATPYFPLDSRSLPISSLFFLKLSRLPPERPVLSCPGRRARVPYLAVSDIVWYLIIGYVAMFIGKMMKKH